MEAAALLWPEQDATGFHYFDFLYARGSPLQALFYSGLFWPQFVEFEGMVFLEGTIEDESDRERVREALRHYGDRAETERSFNTIEVSSELFGRLVSEITDEEYEFLASQICAMWAARLRVLFPNWAFSVEVVPAAIDEVAVRFYRLA